MDEKLRAIGLMGGTFDPVHYGHLVTAEAARCEFNLDKVIFVPSGFPPHKDQQHITDIMHRFLMTLLAISSNPYFEISREEMDRPGRSYTIDTVNYFHQTLGDEVEIYFITGADAILEILTWKDVDKLMSSCYFIAATRPGYYLEELRERLQDLPDTYLNRIFFLTVPAMAISSTEIRARVSIGKTIKYLLPETVEQYIYKKDLYKKE